MDAGTAPLHLPPCACTSSQADSDSHFVKDNGLALKWIFHPGADSCYRKLGANAGAQQCCYYANGTLILEPPGQSAFPPLQIP